MNWRARSVFKQLVFALIVTLAFFLGLELFARLLTDSPVKFFDETRDVQGRVWARYRVGANQPKFLKEKIPGRLRIFAFGGSSTMGIPYCPRSTFPKMLELALQDALGPDRVEVINLGMKGMSSLHVKYCLFESLRYRPDLVIVYAGQNELFQTSLLSDWRHPHLDRLLDALRLHSRLYQVLMHADKYLYMAPAAMGFHQEFVVENLNLDFEHLPIENRPMTESYREDRIQAFRYHLEQMQEKLAEQKIPFLLSTLAVNLKDWPPEWLPFPAGLSPAQSDELKQNLYAAYLDLADGKLDEAETLLEKSEPLAPDYAMDYFVRAGLEEKKGNFAQAREYFLRARRYDPSRHRAPPELNEVIRELSRRPGVFLVDAEKAFFAQTPSAPGFDLLADHVHPNLEGQRLIAQELYRTVIANRLVPVNPPGPDFPTLDRFIKAFQLDDEFLAGIKFLRAVYYLLQRRLPDRDHETISDLNEAIDLRPDFVLARILLASDYLGQYREAEARAALKEIFLTAKNRDEIQKTLERYSFPKIALQGNYLLFHLNLDPVEPLLRGILLVRTEPEQTRTRAILPLDQYQWIFRWSPAAKELEDVTASAHQTFQAHFARCRGGGTKILEVGHYFAVRPSFIPSHDLRLWFKGTELNAELSGQDPWMVFAVTLDPREVREIALQMAVAPEDRLQTNGEVSLYWSGEERPAFSEDQKISLPFKSDGRFHRLKIALGENVNWLSSNKVLFLRLDPAGFKGAVRIKEFKIGLCAPESSGPPRP